MSIFKNSTPSNETSIDAKDSLTQSLPESNEIIQIVSNLEIKERQLNSERQKVLELEEQIVNLSKQSNIFIICENHTNYWYLFFRFSSRKSSYATSNCCECDKW